MISLTCKHGRHDLTARVRSRGGDLVTHPCTAFKRSVPGSCSSARVPGRCAVMAGIINGAVHAVCSQLAMVGSWTLEESMSLFFANNVAVV
jgi:hypothetical protein